MAVSVWVRAGVPRGGVFGTGGAAPAVPPPAIRGWLLASRARPGSGAVRPRPKFRAGRGGCRYRPGHGEAAPLPGPNRQRDGARGHRRTSDEAVGSGEEGGVSRGAGTPPRAVLGPGRVWGDERGGGCSRPPFQCCRFAVGRCDPHRGPWFLHARLCVSRPPAGRHHRLKIPRGSSWCQWGWSCRAGAPGRLPESPPATGWYRDRGFPSHIQLVLGAGSCPAVCVSARLSPCRLHWTVPMAEKLDPRDSESSWVLAGSEVRAGNPPEQTVTA